VVQVVSSVTGRQAGQLEGQGRADVSRMQHSSRMRHDVWGTMKVAYEAQERDDYSFVIVRELVRG
jgi:hypothetical protein